MITERLDNDEKGVSQIDTLGGKQNMNIINESGLYNVIIRSDEDEKGVSQIDTLGGKQQMTVVNESGLYSTLFAMQPAYIKGRRGVDKIITTENVYERYRELLIDKWNNDKAEPKWTVRNAPKWYREVCK